MKFWIFSLAVFIAANLFCVPESKLSHSNQAKTKILIEQELKELESLLINSLSQTEYIKASNKIEAIKDLLTRLDNHNAGDEINITINTSQKHKQHKKKRAIKTEKFSLLIDKIDEENFLEDKITLLQAAAADNYFSINQIMRLLDYFDFDDEKLQALKILYPKITDASRSFELIDLFKYTDTKKQAKNIIKKK